jgi:FMN-dependent NADH-azoreductase
MFVQMHRKTSTELMQEFSEAYRAVNPLDKSAVMTVFTRHFVAVTMSIGSAIHASHADEIDQLVDDLIQADLDQQAMAMLRMMTRLYELNDL